MSDCISVKFLEVELQSKGHSFFFKKSLFLLILEMEVGRGVER